jgi:hypothetical protein
MPDLGSRDMPAYAYGGLFLSYISYGPLRNIIMYYGKHPAMKVVGRYFFRNIPL